MEFIPRPPNRAVRNKFRTHLAALRIDRSLVEVGHSIEEYPAADELVQRLALALLLLAPVRPAGIAHCRHHRGADNPPPRDRLPQPSHNFFHPALYGLRRSVDAEI